MDIYGNLACFFFYSSVAYAQAISLLMVPACHLDLVIDGDLPPVSNGPFLTTDQRSSPRGALLF